MSQECGCAGGTVNPPHARQRDTAKSPRRPEGACGLFNFGCENKLSKPAEACTSEKGNGGGPLRASISECARGRRRVLQHLGTLPASPSQSANGSAHAGDKPGQQEKFQKQHQRPLSAGVAV